MVPTCAALGFTVGIASVFPLAIFGEAGLTGAPFVAGALYMLFGGACAPFRGPMALLSLFAPGAVAAWWLAGGRGVWPDGWWLFVAAVAGGCGGMLVLLHRARGAGSGPAVAPALGVGSLALVLAFGVSYTHPNRAYRATILEGDWKRGNRYIPYASREGVWEVEVVFDGETLGSEEKWTWVQRNGFAWEPILGASAEVPIGIELDSGSGPMGFCAIADDTPAARRRVEELIRRSWERRLKGAWIPPPRPHLSAAEVPIRLKRCAASPR